VKLKYCYNPAVDIMNKIGLIWKKLKKKKRKAPVNVIVKLHYIVDLFYQTHLK